MNKIVLTLSTAMLLSGATAIADDFSNATETHEFDNPQENKDHYQVRVGMLATSGTYNVVDNNGNTSSDYNIENGSGFELSLVSGKKYAQGIDFRTALTLQFNSWSTPFGADISDTMFLGAGEIAYNINKYLSPFFGYYGGIGISNVSDNSAYDNSSQLTYDLGLSVGISGDVYKNFGYYAKYNFVGWKGFNIDDNTRGIRMSPTSLKVGISYTFQ